MKVGVVGLGLIGGSFAKAYSKAGMEVYAYDTDTSIMHFAMLSGAVKAELTDDILPECDLIIISTYPEAAIAYMEQKGPLIGSKPIVVDTCGTKRNVVNAGMEVIHDIVDGTLDIGRHYVLRPVCKAVFYIR